MVKWVNVTKRKRSIDGFMTRRPQRSLLNDRSWQKTGTTIGHMRTDERENEKLHTGDGDEELEMKSGYKDKKNALKAGIDDSLKAIGEADDKKKAHQKKERRKKRFWAKVGAIVAGAIVLLLVGFLIFKIWQALSRVFDDGNLFGIFQQQELKKDAFGRSNFLIVGTTDDDPNHPGGDLTDSMMVLSVSQEKKDVYMFSIPRDLYVKYDRACLPGYSGKINSYFTCVADGDSKEAETQRMDGIRKFVGDIFDMDIQYVAHVNTLVIRDAVNAVGGITVNINSRDPKGVLDESLDWMCGKQGKNDTAEKRRARCPTGHYIDFKNGPAEMDGDKAMWFSRARGHAGFATYGLEQSNFDREKNQQLVIVALKDKALSTGTLTDFGKVMKLIDAMGDNLRTNVDPKEIRTIMHLATEIQDDKVHRLSFVEEGNLLVASANVGGQSVVQPTAGLYNYSEIRKYLRSTIFATPVSKEKAKVIVLNGGETAGVAQAEADKLEKLGMNVVFVGNAPKNKYNKGAIYRIVGEEEKRATAEKLVELYGLDLTAGKPLFSLSTEADFVVIVGGVVQ